MYSIAIIESIHSDAIKFIENNKNFSYELFENTDEDYLTEKLQNYDAISLRTARLTSKMINNCKRLKIVSRHGVGYDSVDLDALNKKGIALTITFKANAVTVAEHALAMMFYLNKKLHLFDSSVRNNKFNELRTSNNKIITVTSELYKKNILIAGFGRIGKELAKRCQAFGMKILVFDPFIEDNVITKFNAEKINIIDEGLPVADYVSLHMPLTKETKYLIGKTQLKKMKKESYIINAARGGIINENDLVEALNNDWIAGAGLDVFEKEPPEPHNPLLNNPKVILTPHSAGLTKECWHRMGMDTITNIINFFEGNLDRNALVNKEFVKL